MNISIDGAAVKNLASKFLAVTKIMMKHRDSLCVLLLLYACQLQAMMAENESVAEIERLSRHEFDLDVEQQKQLQAQCEVEVQKVAVVM